MSDSIFGNVLLYYLNGLLGTWLTVSAYPLLSSLGMEKIISPIVWFGQNTIIILCTSSLVIEVLRILDYKIFSNVLPSLGSMEGIVLCLITMIIEAFTMCCNKYLWFLFGKKISKSVFPDDFHFVS